MARKPKAQRVSMSARLTPGTVARLKSFIRDNSGKPLYLELGSFVERAVLQEIERTERILLGDSEVQGTPQPDVPTRPRGSLNHRISS